MHTCKGCQNVSRLCGLKFLFSFKNLQKYSNPISEAYNIGRQFLGLLSKNGLTMGKQSVLRWLMPSILVLFDDLLPQKNM